VLVLFKNSRFEVLRSLKIAEKCNEVLRLFLNKVREGVVARGRRWAQTDCSHKKLTDLVLFFASSCVLGLCQDLAPRRKRVERRVVGGGIQDSGSMKPRIRNADLLTTHVLDPCVKLLSVLHISSANSWLCCIYQVDPCVKLLAVLHISSERGPGNSTTPLYKYR